VLLLLLLLPAGYQRLTGARVVRFGAWMGNFRE
jgi:hypothetical protein